MKLRAIVVLSALHLSSINAEKLNEWHVQHKRQTMGVFFGRRPLNLDALFMLCLFSY